jgi:hypothetical protein
MGDALVSIDISLSSRPTKASATIAGTRGHGHAQVASMLGGDRSVMNETIG